MKNPIRKTEEKPVVKAPEKAEEPTAEKPKAKGCNVPGCTKKPYFRGLCGGHWNTHRGLADPKEKPRD